MTQFEVKIVDGIPSIVEYENHEYSYIDLKWANPKILKEAKDKGSLCCTLGLQYFELDL